MSNRVQAGRMISILDDALSQINRIGWSDDGDEKAKTLFSLLSATKEIFSEHAKLSAFEKDDMIYEFSSLTNRKEKLSQEIAEFQCRLSALTLKNEIFVNEFHQTLEVQLNKMTTLKEAQEKSVADFITLINEKKQQLIDIRSQDLNTLTDEKLKLTQALHELKKFNREYEEKLKMENFDARCRLVELEKTFSEKEKELKSQINDFNKVIYNEDQERSKLEKHFERIDSDLKQQSQEEDILLQRIDMELKAEQILLCAASKIQSIIHVKKAREQFRKLKKKKKTKKGKSKQNK